MDQHEAAKFDEKVDEFLTIEEHTPFSLLINEVVSWSGAGKTDWALDMGSGPGALLRRVGTPHAVAVDLSFGMCRKARDLGNLAIQADARSLPLRDDSVDAVFATNLLHLLQDPVAAMKEARRVLRLGGPFLCIVPGPEMSEAALVSYLEERFGEMTASFLAGWGRSADNYRRYTQAELGDALQAANLTDVEFQVKWDGLALLAKALK